MSDSKLRRVNVTVTMSDGTVHDVTIGNPDMLRYDEERSKRGWPASAVDAPILWQTFCAWSKLTRDRALDGMPWDAFKFAAEQIDARETVPVDPSPPAHEVD